MQKQLNWYYSICYTKPLRNQKQCQKHLNWVTGNDSVAQPMFFFEIKIVFFIWFGTQDLRVWRESEEAQNPSYGPVWSLYSNWWFGKRDGLYNHLIQNLWARHAFLWWQTLWWCWFCFHRSWHLPTLLKVPNFSNHGITVQSQSVSNLTRWETPDPTVSNIFIIIIELQK